MMRRASGRRLCRSSQVRSVVDLDGSWQSRSGSNGTDADSMLTQCGLSADFDDEASGVWSGRARLGGIASAGSIDLAAAKVTCMGAHARARVRAADLVRQRWGGGSALKSRKGTLESPGELVCGNLGSDDAGASSEPKCFPYRSSEYITEFFAELGTDRVHDGSTRHRWVAVDMVGGDRRPGTFLTRASATWSASATAGYKAWAMIGMFDIDDSITPVSAEPQLRGDRLGPRRTPTHPTRRRSGHRAARLTRRPRPLLSIELLTRHFRGLHWSICRSSPPDGWARTVGAKLAPERITRRCRSSHEQLARDGPRSGVFPCRWSGSLI